LQDGQQRFQTPLLLLHCLQACAATVGAQLQLAPSLSSFLPAAAGHSISVGLAGEHQLLNASLAVALVQSWEQHAANKQQQQKQQQQMVSGVNDEQQQQQQQQVSGGGVAGASLRLQQLQQGLLPQEYCEGLRTAAWPGRSQVCAG
jgi:folylpolyglutamate synthase/dihydropteroate synthase